jgi:hypothetical protein
MHGYEISRLTNCHLTKCSDSWLEAFMTRFEAWAAVAVVTAAVVFAGAANRYRPAGAASNGTVWVIDGLTGEPTICKVSTIGDMPWTCRTAEQQAAFDAVMRAQPTED